MNLRARSSGFSLLELLTVVVIIAVLTLLTLPVVDKVRTRAEKANCMNNLRGLYVAAGGYLGQHNHWPQIDPLLAQKDPKAYAEAWNGALSPYGISRKNWICPTLQRLLKDPDFDKSETARVDYRAMPFDANPETPYRWPKQPWFVEAADMHGAGQLIIQTDGSLHEVNDLIIRKSQ